MQSFESVYKGANKELNIICPQYFVMIITYRTSNQSNFLVICLHKNTKIQDETNISANIGRLKHQLFITSALRFYTSLCLCQNTTFLPSFTAKQCKTKKLCENAARVFLRFSENLATSHVHGSRNPEWKTIRQSFITSSLSVYKLQICPISVIVYMHASGIKSSP